MFCLPFFSHRTSHAVSPPSYGLMMRAFVVVPQPPTSCGLATNVSAIDSTGHREPTRTMLIMPVEYSTTSTFALEGIQVAMFRHYLLATTFQAFLLRKFCFLFLPRSPLVLVPGTFARPKVTIHTGPVEGKPSISSLLYVKAFFGFVPVNRPCPAQPRT